MKQPVDHVAHRLERLRESDGEDQGERRIVIAGGESDDGDGGDGERRGDEPQREVDREGIVAARVGGLEYPQVQIRQRDDRGGDGEAERELADVDGIAELGDADEDTPLKSGVTDVADESPSDVGTQRDLAVAFHLDDRASPLDFQSLPSPRQNVSKKPVGARDAR